MAQKEILQQLMGKQMSRGQFIRSLGLGAGIGFLLGSGIDYLLYTQTNIMLPDSPSAHDLLETKAIDTERKNEHVSFIPEGKFTKEFFDKVRNSTYAVEVINDKGARGGTGWCAHKEGNNIYIATNRHVTNLEDRQDTKITGINIWRPNIDRQKIAPSRTTVFTTEAYDIAILKCELDPEQAREIIPVVFQDDAEIKNGEKVLTVGFPAEFRKIAADGINFLTSGDIATVEYVNKKDNEWYGRGLANPGSSGSPAVIPDKQGNPRVIGIIFGGDEFILRENWREKRKQPIVAGLTLNINPLIQYARKT